MYCPNCRKTVTLEHWKENPDCVKVGASFVGLFRSAQRTTHAPGREPIPTRCPKCGAKCLSVRAAGEHCRKPRSQRK
jgi:hypothetical protein